MFHPIHRHLITTAILSPDLMVTERRVRDWLIDLVEAVAMRVLDGPLTARCDDPGNEGVTGIILLTTSHASIHTWERGGPDDSPYAQFDLYSCKPFDPSCVVELFRECFRPVSIDYRLIDRNPH